MSLNENIESLIDDFEFDFDGKKEKENINSQIVLDRLEKKENYWLTVSGKTGSGKDTLAPEFMKIIAPDSTNVRIGYSDFLRAEAQDIFTTFLEQGGNSAASLLHEKYGMKYTHAIAVVGVIDRSQQEKVLLDPYSRSLWMTNFLINLGGKWHTVDDPYYLPNKAWEKVQKEVLAGHNVYLTGGRLLPDILLPNKKKALTVRVEISKEVQKERLSQRDGIIPPIEMLEGESETALDEHLDLFDIVVSNNNSFEETLEEFKEKYAEWLKS